MFGIERFPSKILIICIVSVMIGIYNFFLLERTGLYSGGAGAIFQSIARCVSYFLKKHSFVISAKAVHTILFWGMSLFMNIPLAIVGFRKIGFRFTILTILNISISSLTSMMLSSLPVSWGLKNFYLFSDPRTFNCSLLDNGIQILQWNYITNISNTGSGGGTQTFISVNDSSRIIIIFLYGFIFGVLNAISSIFIYSLGGSTGGIDWIIYYYIKNKRKRFTQIYLYMGIIITFVAYVVGTYVPYADHLLSGSSKTSCDNSVTLQDASQFNNNHHSVISSLVGPMFVATLISIFVKRLCYRVFYPRWHIVTAKIYTEKAVELRKKLIESNFPQSFTINISIGGYRLRNQTIFEVTCFVVDLKILRELAMSVDPSCLIVSTPVKSFTGRFVVKDNIS